MERRIRTNSRRIAIKIEYDGQLFHGWQIQNNGRTVQSEIENALKVLTGEEIKITASGRTDAGVHALGQVAHFDISKNIPLLKICKSLNGIMQNDVAITNAYYVPNEFHARYDACEREYLYKIYNHKLFSPFIFNRALWVKHKLDLDYLNEATQCLIGTHDFASFCKKISSDENTVRTINSINFEKKDNYIYFTIKGTAFLHNMIRIIIGSLVDMTKNNLKVDYLKEIVGHRDRDMSGHTASACGLYLKKVRYDPDLDSYESAV